MIDNSTSSKASEYDGHVPSVNPNYRLFHEVTLGLVRVARPEPQKWLDTGGGTGTLVSIAAAAFPGAVFTLADPSEAMLGVAREKFRGSRVEFLQKGTQELEMNDCSFDVITAVLSHHYFQPDQRRNATANCFRMLKPGGVFVTFEHVRPNSEEGLQIGLARWGEFQAGMGRSREEIKKHLMRFDKEYFPITVEQHLKLLRESGFGVVEMLYLGVMQAGFYAIKGLDLTR